MRVKFAEILFFSCILCSSLSAQDIGGIVVGSESDKPLPGVNVLVEGTLLGASTTSDGTFRIEGLPPGVYALRITMMGYKPEVIESVDVPSEFAESLRIALTPQPLSVATVVITAGRRPEYLAEAPASIEVISEQTLSATDHETIDEAIRYLPGVNFIEDQMNVRGSSGYSRGVGTRVLYMVDGIPLTSGEVGDVKWNALPVFDVERIELLKGAGSALYGSSAMGGVVNVLTKNPAETPETKIRLSTGFYDKPSHESFEWTNDMQSFRSVSASHSRMIGRSGVLIAANRYKTDGYRRNGQSERYSIFLKTDYRISPASSLKLISNIASDDHGLFSGWVSPNSPFETPRDTWSDRTVSDKFNAHASYRRLISPKKSFSARLNYYRTHFANSTGGGHDRSTTDKPGFDLQFNSLHERHTLVLGTELWQTVVDADMFGDHDVTDMAAYLQDELALSEIFKLVLGGRLDYHRVDELDARLQFNPKAAFLWSFSEGAAVHINAGRGFRAPSVAEMFTSTQLSIFTVAPNPDLEPESSWSYEAAFRGALSKKIGISTAVFRNDFRGLIEGGLDPDGIIRFHNKAKAKVQGVEISLKANPVNPLELNGSYTYIDSRDLELDEPLPYRHRHMYTFYSVLKAYGLRLSSEYRYMSEVEEVSLYEEDPVTGKDRRVPIELLDFRIEIPVGFGIMRLAVENAVNHLYTEVERSMGPVRRYTGSVSASF